jgi:hypothetical protein
VVVVVEKGPGLIPGSFFIQRSNFFMGPQQLKGVIISASKSTAASYIQTGFHLLKRLGDCRLFSIVVNAAAIIVLRLSGVVEL